MIHDSASRIHTMYTHTHTHTQTHTHAHTHTHTLSHSQLWKWSFSSRCTLYQNQMVLPLCALNLTLGRRQTSRLLLQLQRRLLWMLKVADCTNVYTLHVH